MNMTAPRNGMYTFWGGALSLYSGKVRAYLIKKGIPYREFYSSHPEFQQRVRPIIRLSVTPILETPNGEVLQDSTEIITALESNVQGHAMIPSTPVLRTVATLLDAFATEHLLLAAMHYRWAEPYVSRQRAFLCAEFGRVSYLGSDREARNSAGTRMMSYFGAVLNTLGGTTMTSPAIEAAYLELLERLDIHFQHMPYLLGGHPSIADFGFMAPLFAHLGRDPEPANIMALRAPNVMRWKERMNLAAIEDAEFPSIATEFSADDEVPPTLEPILELIFRDWTPELRANADCFNTWLSENPALPIGHLVCLDGKRRVHPTIGPLSYHWRNVVVNRASAPQTLWNFNRVQKLERELTGLSRQKFDALLERVNGKDAMNIKMSRTLNRNDYVLVLGE